MLDNYKIGNQIFVLRKEKGLTGEKLAELLGVSGQAVSKWENGKNLPETAILPELAHILGISIDALLMPQELVILDAKYSCGESYIVVTDVLNRAVENNSLQFTAKCPIGGHSVEGPAVFVLTVKYQTPKGIYYTFVPQGETLKLNIDSIGVTANDFEIIGAYYGTASSYRDCMDRIKHVAYFKWNEIPASAFPSRPGADELEFLTLVYLNAEGIHVVSCMENETLAYKGTSLYLKDTSTCILPGIAPLVFDEIPCTWVGAIHAALKYMGETYTYEQIYGMSGACFRASFCDIWDWSATDALVTYSYDMPLYDALGYEPVWANRLEKEARKAERERIVSDIRNGKPVVAINLRITHEWGVITGYKENGNVLLCRTYYDDTQEYPEADNWPFLICHFGDRKEKPSDSEIFTASLRAFTESFEMRSDGGYFQGAQAYEKWIEGLQNDSLWDERSSEGDIARRFDVNLWTLFHLIDARRCAAAYLEANLHPEMAQSYQNISERMNELKEAIRLRTLGDSWRAKQVEFLKWVLREEKELCRKVKGVVESPRPPFSKGGKEAISRPPC
ncbi:MAG: helix-turn-helix domain-containing protein [Oscillospiraceae bacterium]|nr:helix-turn-helix domain-containing protein [Oscillospiraceae bacterium]